jgi:uncharacterized protein involved in exopolysaccharide biosynthesis
MNQGYNLLGVIKLLIKWKKQIVIVTLAAGLLTALFSWLFMDNYYKASATILPVNMTYSDRTSVFKMDHDYFYAGKEDVNRLMTMAESMSVRDSIIARYNLVKHYKIDANNPHWRTMARKEFESNCHIVKTEQNAVEITVYDTDPKTAADIVGTILDLVEYLNHNNVQASTRKQLETFKNQMTDWQKQVAIYSDSLALLGKQYNIQVKSLAGSEVIEGSDQSAIQLYRSIYTRMKSALQVWNESTIIAKQYEATLANEQKSISIVDAPTVPDKKDKPMRMVITAMAMLFACIFSIFGVLLIDQTEEIRKQL